MIQRIFVCVMMLNLVTAPQAQIKPATRRLPALEHAINAFAPDEPPDCKTGGDWPKTINVNAIYRDKPGSNRHVAVMLKVCYDEKGLAWGTMRYLRDDDCKQCRTRTDHTYVHAACVKVFEDAAVVVIAGPVAKSTGDLHKSWIEYDFKVTDRTLRVWNRGPGSTERCQAIPPPTSETSFQGVYESGEVNLR